MGSVRKFRRETHLSFHVVGEDIWAWVSSQSSWGSLSLKHTCWVFMLLVRKFRREAHQKKLQPQIASRPHFLPNDTKTWMCFLRKLPHQRQVFTTFLLMVFVSCCPLSWVTCCAPRDDPWRASEKFQLSGVSSIDEMHPRRNVRSD